MPHRSFPPSHFNPPRLLPATVVGLMRARSIFPAPPSADSSPRDTVLLYPTLTPQTTLIVAFDSEGNARVRTECEASKAPSMMVLALAWVRREYPAKKRIALML